LHPSRSAEGSLVEAEAAAFGRREHLTADVLWRSAEVLRVAAGSEPEVEVLPLDAPERIE